MLSVVGGMAVLLPSLFLLFGLVLGGRFDAAARAPARRPGAAPARLRLAVPAALGLAGAPLALFAGDAGAYAGFALLLAFVATGALALLGPALEEDG